MSVILPLVVGALALGLMTVFSLQTSVSNRLADTTDAQLVSANFLNDVQGAGFVTTEASSTPQCGTGDQLLGLGSNFNANADTFDTSVSYDVVQTSGGSSPTYSLVRYNCTDGSTTPSSSSTISYNLPATPSNPSVICNTGANCDVAHSWISSQYIAKVEFSITETHAHPSSSYQFTVAAVPQANANIIRDTGTPISSSTKAGCGFATAGTGTYASTLCLVDFSALTGNNLLAAENGCLEVEVTLPGNDQLYFCVGITGAPVVPASLPTYPEAFLGNSTNGSPFYTGIPGDPALYQSCEGYNAACGADNYNGKGQTIVTFSGITVVDAQGDLATGWEAVSADAETTDVGESISWTSNTNLYVLPNGQSYDTPTDPVGNACNAGAGLTGSGLMTVTCDGDGTTSALKDGTPIVWALTPKTITATLTGTGLEAVAFGLILS